MDYAVRCLVSAECQRLDEGADMRFDLRARAILDAMNLAQPFPLKVKNRDDWTFERFEGGRGRILLDEHCDTYDLLNERFDAVQRLVRSASLEEAYPQLLRALFEREEKDRVQRLSPTKQMQANIEFLHQQVPALRDAVIAAGEIKSVEVKASGLFETKDIFKPAWRFFRKKEQEAFLPFFVNLVRALESSNSHDILDAMALTLAALKTPAFKDSKAQHQFLTILGISPDETNDLRQVARRQWKIVNDLRREFAYFRGYLDKHSPAEKVLFQQLLDVPVTKQKVAQRSAGPGPGSGA